MRCPVPSASAPSRLSTDELAARLDRILGAAGELVTRIPDDRMDWSPPALGAPLRDVGFHVFRLGLAFADGMDLGRVRPAWLREGAPSDLSDGPSIARYGALVRARLSGWFEGAGRSEYDRTIDLAGQSHSGRAFLTDTVRHTAYHLQGLHAALNALGIAPLAPPDPDLDAV
jgi:hypothetical protein